MINETWRIAPWADALYACDEKWWRARGPAPDDFAGLRFQGHIAPGGSLVDGCIPCGVDPKVRQMLFCGDRLGSGANSGFQAVNLAAVAGAARIILTGFDLSLDFGVHWHGRHGDGLTNPDARMLAGCAALLDQAAAPLRQMGIDVINASRHSALRAYRKLTMEAALGT